MYVMFNDILVIADSLVEPPSEILPFRTITMLAHDHLGMECLLHTTQDMKDLYYHWMKPRGMMDYITYILHELEFEDGVRLDTVGFYPHTILTKYIRLENQIQVLGKIQAFRH